MRRGHVLHLAAERGVVPHEHAVGAQDRHPDVGGGVQVHRRGELAGGASGPGAAAGTDGGDGAVTGEPGCLVHGVDAGDALAQPLDDRIIKTSGLGLATAVLVDDTVVRMLIVPATLAVLGTAAWWLPSRIDRVLPALAIEPDLSVKPADPL